MSNWESPRLREKHREANRNLIAWTLIMLIVGIMYALATRPLPSPSDLERLATGAAMERYIQEANK